MAMVAKSESLPVIKRYRMQGQLFQVTPEGRPDRAMSRSRADSVASRAASREAWRVHSDASHGDERAMAAGGWRLRVISVPVTASAATVATGNVLVDAEEKESLFPVVTAGEAAGPGVVMGGDVAVDSG